MIAVNTLKKIKKYVIPVATSVISAIWAAHMNEKTIEKAVKKCMENDFK